MSEHSVGGDGRSQGAVQWAAPEAPEVEPAAVQEPAVRQEAEQPLRPALPLGWQTRVEPVARELPAEAGTPAAVEALALAEEQPPDDVSGSEPPHPPRLGSVTPPLRIIAAIVGVALVAVPFSMATTKAAPAPAPQPHVAHFQVPDRKVPIFWHPGSGTSH